VTQQRPPRPGPGLRQLLGREYGQREARVHQLGRQPRDRPGAARDHGVGEADLLRVGHPLVDAAEGASVEQVRRVDGVPPTAQPIGKRDNPGRQPLRVVEQHYLGH
jgi:hypothetical protein